MNTPETQAEIIGAKRVLDRMDAIAKRYQTDASPMRETPTMAMNAALLSQVRAEIMAELGIPAVAPMAPDGEADRSDTSTIWVEIEETRRAWVQSSASSKQDAIAEVSLARVGTDRCYMTTGRTSPRKPQEPSLVEPHQPG